jgi:hypothetical protein
VLNPALVEMQARDRIAEMRRVGATRSSGRSSYPTVDNSRARTFAWSIPAARRTETRRALGWFLVSVGLRLAVPRPRGGSAR